MKKILGFLLVLSSVTVMASSRDDSQGAIVYPSNAVCTPVNGKNKLPSYLGESAEVKTLEFWGVQGIYDHGLTGFKFNLAKKTSFGDSFIILGSFFMSQGAHSEYKYVATDTFEHTDSVDFTYDQVANGGPAGTLKIVVHPNTRFEKDTATLEFNCK